MKYSFSAALRDALIATVMTAAMAEFARPLPSSVRSTLPSDPPKRVAQESKVHASVAANGRWML